MTVLQNANSPSQNLNGENKYFSGDCETDETIKERFMELKLTIENSEMYFSGDGQVNTNHSNSTQCDFSRGFTNMPITTSRHTNSFVNWDRQFGGIEDPYHAITKLHDQPLC